MYKVGMDVGSTTIKMVVLDDDNKTVYESYERHKSQVRKFAVAKMKELSSILEGKDVHMAITGSAGLGIAKETGIPFVQEVFATAQVVKKEYEDTGVVIELGGEDAKIIFLQGSVEERMNSTCAGGTGAFIDQMAALLNLDLAQMDEASLNATQLYPIASRCGVFAKTDVQPLINQGVSKENLSASIFQAVVDQTIAGLAQGRRIEGNVLFLGGPLFFLKGLQKRFIETLKLSSDEAIFPKSAPYFVAYGAAVYSTSESAMPYQEIVDHLVAVENNKADYHDLGALFETDDDYNDFIERHKQADVPRSDLATYKGKTYLGIDAGSTTTKLVLIGEDDSILYESYSNNHGNPIDVVLEQLKIIYEQMNDDTTIGHAAVTGYGEELIKSAFRLDEGLVETIAHYRAARHFNPNVDFIIDIGGQDMKCFKIKDQSIDSILLNEACSSGCGSFLETFANSMGYNIQDFSSVGLNGKQPVDLGTRCTVFMNSSVKSAQKNGASIENISAGLSMSVVKNALYKVIRAKNADEVGKEIVVQGGTFLNDTVLRSFEKELGRNVIRPAIAHLMGAYGCALFAKSCGDTSSILSAKDIDEFEHKSIATTCGLCTNKCSLTINTFKDGSKHISGNKCERPISGKQQKNDLPDLFKYKYEKLRSYKSHEGERGKVGLPLVLNMFENLPFWHTFFDELNYEVVWSEPSTKQLYALGQHTIPSDTACYPAKLVHGHIQSLLNQGVQRIFYPSMTYNTNENLSDNYFNCPVVAYYPEVIHANMEVEDIVYMYPYLSFEDRDLFIDRIQQCFEDSLTFIERDEIANATAKAYDALAAYQNDVKEEGARAIQFAQDNKVDTIVLAGRPYHIDPQVNHGINGLLTSLGFAVISEDALPYLEKSHVNVLNQWTYHARMYNAANVVANLPHTELIQLVNFGCGIDAITGDEISSMLHKNNKLYTQIKIDEIDNLGAVKIRCRSLQAAMKERSQLHGY